MRENDHISVFSDINHMTFSTYDQRYQRWQRRKLSPSVGRRTCRSSWEIDVRFPRKTGSVEKGTTVSLHDWRLKFRPLLMILESVWRTGWSSCRGNDVPILRSTWSSTSFPSILPFVWGPLPPLLTFLFSDNFWSVVFPSFIEVSPGIVSLNEIFLYESLDFLILSRYLPGLCP